MVTINQILKDVDVLEVENENFLKSVSDVSCIVYNSKKITNRCLFVCLKGAKVDGHEFAETAVKNGANIILSEKKLGISGIPNVIVKNSRQSLAIISRNFFDAPAKKLTTIAITGTKGKTTTSFLIRDILENNGYRVGVIGTIGIFIGDEVVKTENTTPESYEIQKNLNKMVEKGCEFAVIEATSIGLKNHRLDGITFDYGIFTNFSEDHIGENEHSSIDEYLSCKRILFSHCKTGILNCDDSKYSEILQNHTCAVKTFGLSEKSDIYAKNITCVKSKNYIGTSFEVKMKGQENSEKLYFETTLVGKFNVYNILAAIFVTRTLGANWESIERTLKSEKINGRVEIIENPFDFTIFIDFAHNADSMRNLLETLREYQPKRLIVMFGSGGNRAKSRRSNVGEVTGKLADESVVTADNSRYENVSDIIADIVSGIKKSGGNYTIIENRYDAIRYCLETAKKGDFIVLAGKGHEDYQEIAGIKHKFDEHEIVKNILREMQKQKKY